MADGRVVFPVKFDLDAAVKEASGDIDRVLKRMGTMVASRPLQVRIDTSGTKAYDSSIKSIQNRMSELIKQWNRLTDAQKYSDGSLQNYSAKAMLIIQEYAKLTAATRTHARTLEELTRAADKAADAEIKKNQKVQAELEKRMAKSRQMVAMLNAEETTLSSVAAKIKFYKESAGKSDFGSTRYRYATAQLERLGAQYERLRNIFNSSTGNQGKDIFNAEKIKSTLKGAEGSIGQVKAKLKAVDQILAKVPTDSFGFRRASEEGQRLLKLLRDMEANTPKNQIKAQEQLQKEWLAAKDQRERERQREVEQAVANANRENQARQTAYNRQREAGLERQRILKAEETSISAVTAKLKLQQERLDDAKVGTAKYEKIRVEVERLTKKLGDMREILEAAGKRVEALRALREILSASEKTISGINGKLQVYQERLQGLEAGSRKFNRTVAEVRRLSEELQRANQYLSDFQSKAFKGLSTNFTAKQTEAVINLRDQIDAIDKKFNMLYQNGRATNADGTYTTRVNDMLRERARLQSEISRMMTTAADAQIQREKEINRIQEQRKAKAQAIADKKKSETKAVQANIAKLKEERRVLNQQESSIKAITDKLNIMQRRLNSTNMKSGEFEKVAKEVERLTAKLDKANQKVRELTGQTTSGASRQAADARLVSQEYSRQYTYLDRLVRRMAVYASIGMIGGFLTKVREVTAQFELQRVSLGAILQDQNKANLLFSEIKSFALKSPVSILDLTKYTKQLAAYKIGYDELFETTKKLTDVSVGLGVSMDRVVLAYGQVRATGHLRASEVRQFTEMGVPIVEELAAKLSKMNGEMVRAADVMDMISKRAISFDMVKEVFDDMTSAGGIFYNMQEKQGNTLYGLWAKLGDAASVMYAEIGNTGIVDSAMKGMISGITTLMKNWRIMGGYVILATALYGKYWLAMKNAAVAAKALTLAEATNLAVQNKRIITLPKLTTSILSANAATKASTWLTNMHTTATARAAAATNIFSKAWYKLTAAMLANPFTAIITAVAAIGVAIAGAVEKATRLNRELGRIKEETLVLQNQSVQNFKSLADAAVNSADGSKKQRDALAELQRTYRDIIPEENLKIENLRKMKGDYDSLTASIMENIRAQQLQKGLSEISSSYEKKIIDAERLLVRQLQSGVLVTGADIGERQAERMTANIRKMVEEGISGAEALKAAYDMEGITLSAATDWERLANVLGVVKGESEGLAGAILSLRTEMDRFTSDMGQPFALLGKYAGYLEDAKKYVENYAFSSSPDSPGFGLEKAEVTAKAYMDALKKALSENRISIEDYIIADPEGNQVVNWAALENAISGLESRMKIPLRNMAMEVKGVYEDFVPSDPVVREVRAKLWEISEGSKIGMERMSRYLWDGKTDIKDHVKTLQDAVSDIEREYYKYSELAAKWGEAGKRFLSFFGIDLDKKAEEISLLKKIIAHEQTYIKPEESKDKNKGGTKSDPRLQTLQEIANKMAEVNKEYDELLKKEGQTKALADTQKLFASSFKQMEATAKKYGFKLPAFEVPQTIEDVQKWHKAIMDNIKRLNLKNADKVLIELGFKSDKAAIDKQQKKIEAELKRLADRISRTKTAKEFYENILSTTGDHSLASKVAESIFGQNGSTLQKALADQVRGMTNKIELPEGIISSGNIIDYKALRQFAEANKKELGGMYDELVKISEQGQKDLVKTYEGYLKDLEKAKTYSDKRIELARYTANQIAEINASALPQGEKDRLTAGYKEREKQKQGELEWEAFKDMPMYVQMFDDLDNASGTMLSNMKAKLLELQSVWGSTLNPTQLKELQSRLSEIDAQLAKKNPFKTLSDAMKQYRALSKGGTQADAERKLIEATDKRQAAQQKLNMALDVSRTAQERYNEAVSKYGADSEQAKNAKLFWDAAKSGVEDAGKLVEQTGLSEKEAQRLVAAWKKVKDAIGLSLGEVFQITHSLGDLAGGIGKLTEVFGGDEEDVQYWNDIAAGLNEVTSGIENMVQAAISGNPIGIVTSAVTAIPNMISGFVGLFSAGKVRKANKEIKRQQELLEQLEYTYSRLEKASEKLFGVGYLQNYNQQIKVLQAQQQAYLKQAQAERSKGKKEDKEKTKEFENQARETANKIKELQDDLVAHFTGSDRQSAARDFAQSWLEAKVAFANTADAIKSKYKDLIKNMIIEGAAAKVIDNILGPMYDKMGELLSKNDIQGAIDYLVNGMDAFVEQADNGLNVLWKALEARGYDMKEMLGDVDSGYTGIAKDIAGATSEEINAVAAIGNTLMYHTAYLPQIYQEIAAWRAASMRSAIIPAASDVPAVDNATLQTEAMNHYKAIEANTAATVAELRGLSRMLNRVIVSSGGTFAVNTRYAGR